MTKKEKKLIKKAIRLIHHDDDYYGGMDILAKMVGWEANKQILDPCTIAEFIEQKSRKC